MKKLNLVFGILIAMTFTFSSCSKEKDILKKFGIFKVQEGGTSALIDGGSIGSKTLKHFNKMLDNYPNINTIHFQYSDGSKDDDTNFLVGKAIYENDINTNLLDDGNIVSGAVDLFLAGRKRSIGEDVQIGVHSWTDGQVDADDLPNDSEEHELYFDYFEAVGFTPEAAEKFYFFTINAASAEEIHWMTEEEIETYNIVR